MSKIEAHYHSMGDIISFSESQSKERSHHEEVKVTTDREWLNHGPKYEALRDVVNGTKSLESEGRLRHALKEACEVNTNVVEIVCIDEGIGATTTEGQKIYQLGIGGSGILLPEAGLQAFVEYLTDLHSQGKEIRITSHGSCGAAALSSGEHEPHAVIDVAQTFGEKLAEVLSQKTDTEISHRFIPIESMTRPEAAHNAFGAFVDTTGRFNPARESNTYTSDELPPMFNISATYNNISHVVDNVQVAVDIAMGGHGFGARFTKEQPFLVCVVIDKHEDQQFEDELHNALLEKFGENKRIVIRLLDVSHIAEESVEVADNSVQP